MDMLAYLIDTYYLPGKFQLTMVQLESGSFAPSLTGIALPNTVMLTDCS